MCDIISTRKNSRYVFIEVSDDHDDLWGVKRMRPAAFEFAKKFRNKDFLVAAAEWTKDDDRRDDGAYEAEYFEDPDVEYTSLEDALAVS